MHGRVGLAQDACQFRRIDEWHPAESLEQLSFGERHILDPKGVEGTFPMPRGRGDWASTETKGRNSNSSDESS